MVAAALWTQELLPRVDRRVYRRVNAVRYGDVAYRLDSLSRLAGSVRRRFAGDRAGRASRHVSRRADGDEPIDLRARHHPRSVTRTDARRNSRRQLLLA